MKKIEKLDQYHDDDNGLLLKEKSLGPLNKPKNASGTTQSFKPVG